MPLNVQCPACRQSFSIRDELAGKKVRCKCGGVIAVPPAIGPTGAAPVPGAAVSPERAPMATPVGRPPQPAERGYEVEAGSRVTRPQAVPRPAADDEDEQESKPPSNNPLDYLPGSKALYITPLVLAVLAFVVRVGLPLAIRVSRGERARQTAVNQVEQQNHKVAAGPAPLAPKPVTTEVAPAIPPSAETVSDGGGMATVPYALDSDSERSRSAEPLPGEAFPATLTFNPRASAIVKADLMLSVAPDQPGHDGRLVVYKPDLALAPQSTGCMLLAPAAGPDSSGASAAASEQDALAFAGAGYVVIAFQRDGQVIGPTASPDEITQAASAYLAAQGGLVNARNALEFALTQLPEIDAKRVYVAGRGESGALALLFAEHEPRIAGCIALDAATDLSAPLTALRLRSAQAVSPASINRVIEITSPLKHAAKLSGPTCLMAAKVSAVRALSDKLAAQLRAQRKSVEFASYKPDAGEAPGIDLALAWLKELQSPAKVAAKSPRRVGAPADQPEMPAKPAAAPDGPLANKPLSGAGGGSVFRQSAANESRMHHAMQAYEYMLADVLTSSDEDLIGYTRWSPGLKRPAAVLHWGFGAEMKGAADSAPANLRVPGAGRRERSVVEEQRLSNNLKSATGNIGIWLAEGLKHRVEAGSFGQWASESEVGAQEHRGITLLDFAPLEQMLADARTNHADVLLIHSLSREEGRAVTTMVVQIHDVATGKKLWESKPISSSRIAAGRRQGKNIEADFAGEVLEAVDKLVVLQDLPELTAQQVQARLKDISERRPTSLLAALAELRYYQLRKLISTAEARKYLAELVADEDAQILSSGDAAARRQVVERLATAGQ